MRTIVHAFVALVLSMGGCARSNQSPMAGAGGAPQGLSPASSSRVAPAAVASATPREPWAAAELASSSTSTPYVEKNPVVVIARSGISLVGDSAATTPVPPPESWSAGVDAAYKRSGPNDLFIVPLAAGLARVKPASNATLAIAVDKAIPYRLFTEVLFTAGQQEYGAFRLLVQGRDGVSAIGTTPPKFGGSRRTAPIEAALNLVVLLVNDGISVKATGGSIRPGCDGIGPGLTLPSIGGVRDQPGLRACVTRLRQSNPAFAGETQVTVVANANIPFSDVVLALDALRESGFSDVYFGIAK
jgi:biopolymer transport protein ExbD